MTPRSNALVLASVLLGFACGGVTLPFPEEKTTDAIMKLAAARDAENSGVADGLEALNGILLDVFADHYVPIPDGEIVPYIVSASREYSGADAFRWGYGLPEDPGNEKNVGAFVARPVSVGYSTMLPLAVDGDTAAILHTNFRSNERIYDGGSPDEFLAGNVDLATSANHTVNLGPKGIAFEYDSHTTLRRIRDERFPGGEAMISWELMDGEAVRIEGGYNAYLKYLKNLNILLPLSEKLAFWVVASWSESGGSLFIFSAGGTSGDIADGIRHDYTDWEEYFAARDLTCLKLAHKRVDGPRKPAAEGRLACKSQPSGLGSPTAGSPRTPSVRSSRVLGSGDEA